jgi:hypothetical protein
MALAIVAEAHPDAHPMNAKAKPRFLSSLPLAATTAKMMAQTTAQPMLYPV